MSRPVAAVAMGGTRLAERNQLDRQCSWLFCAVKLKNALALFLICENIGNMSDNFSREHASKGFFVVDDTNATAKSFYGFTVTTAAVVSSISAPTNTSPEGTSYDGDESGLATETLPPGYYPIRGSSITLTSGVLILWLE